MPCIFKKIIQLVQKHVLKKHHHCPLVSTLSSNGSPIDAAIAPNPLPRRPPFLHLFPAPPGIIGLNILLRHLRRPAMVVFFLAPSIRRPPLFSFILGGVLLVSLRGMSFSFIER